jgi:histidine triad (HIT) family protein
MAESCIFCKIVAGEIPAQIVYKDEHTCAFLDAHPLSKGHTLVVPVRHHTRLEALAQGEAEKHLGVLPQIVNAVTQVAQADGATVAWNNGPAAGQEVPHLHAHIVPRFEHDRLGPIHALFDQRPSLSETQQQQIAQRLETALRH